MPLTVKMNWLREIARALRAARGEIVRAIDMSEVISALTLPGPMGGI